MIQITGACDGQHVPRLEALWREGCSLAQLGGLLLFWSSANCRWGTVFSCARKCVTDAIVVFLRVPRRCVIFQKVEKHL